tara:strand:+ start:388 stop:534 length:147 start_codon:yes stop_codon:yes gene_type:complete
MWKKRNMQNENMHFGIRNWLGFSTEGEHVVCSAVPVLEGPNRANYVVL